MGGSSGGSDKTTTKTSPWASQVPYLKYGMDEARRLYEKNTPQYYSGSTVAGFSPEQNTAFQLGTQRALNGSQSMQNAEGFSNNVLGGQYSGDAGARGFANASMGGAYGGDAGARGFANAATAGMYGGDAGAKGYVGDVLSGKYLNSNPYNDQVFANIQQQVLPATNAQFMGSGRYGSDLHAGTVATNLTNAYAPYASQQYQQGLDRMGQAANMSDSMYNANFGRMAQGAGMADAMYNNAYNRMYGGAGMLNDMYNTDVANRFNAAGMAPTFAANDYTDLGALEAIGAQKQGLGQQELNDAVARWNYYQQLPYNQLGQLLNNVGGNYGGTVVGKTPSQEPSTFQQIAGAGLGILGTAGGLGWKPFG